MQFFTEGWEIGLFHLPFMGEMPIPIIIWCAILAVAGIQLMLCWSKRKWLRYSLLSVSLAGFLIFAVLCEIDTGWDLLGWLIFAGIFFVMLIGCAIGFGVHKLLNRENKNEM